jgi:hypothetical protein
VTFTALAVPGSPAFIREQGGNNQEGTPGGALPTQLHVIISDAFDNPVPNAVVQWIYAASLDSGTVAPVGGDSVRATGSVAAPTLTAYTTSDAEGNSRATWTLGPSALAGLQAVRVSVSGAATVRFVSTIPLPGDLATLESYFEPVTSSPFELRR